jgi:hypothetical protein
LGSMQAAYEWATTGRLGDAQRRGCRWRDPYDASRAGNGQ